MTLSKFNQQWFDDGRKARLAAQLHAYQTKTPVHLPLSSYNATAAEHWRNGWNSVTREDIKNHCQPRNLLDTQNSYVCQIRGRNFTDIINSDPIANARRAIQ
jgi:hypothetical protein